MPLFVNAASTTIYRRYIINLGHSFLKMNTSVLKPPNVLVYSNEKSFKNISKNLYKCLHSDKYVIYQLKQNQVLKTPWKENVALLVVSSEELDKSVTEEFINYLTKSGKLLVVSSNFEHPKFCAITKTDEVTTKVKYLNVDKNLRLGKYIYSVDKGYSLAKDEKGGDVIHKLDTDNGTLIVSSVKLLLEPSNSSEECGTEINSVIHENNLSVLKSLLTEQLGLEGYVSKLLSPSSGYIIVDNETRLKDLLSKLTISEISLEKPNRLPSEINQSPELKVPLLSSYDDSKTSLFDKESYYSALKTEYLGKIVVFFPVVTSTMNPVEHLSAFPGLVVIANRQLLGKGRGGNVWISPEGCASFTLHVPTMLSSKLGQRLSIVQHMASLAVVHGLQKRPGYGNLDFRLKWPNDLYYEKDKKIGGVLVNTTIQGDIVHIYIGIGVNVSNEMPTICVNSIIKEQKVVQGESLLPLKVEEVIASTLTELESLVDDFSKHGAKNFLDLYYKYWIHKDQSIVLGDSDTRAVVKSIDDYGFLIVETEDGKKLSVQPDGNRFDMMKNLIVSKEL